MTNFEYYRTLTDEELSHEIATFAAIYVGIGKLTKVEDAILSFLRMECSKKNT